MFFCLFVFFFVSLSLICRQFILFCAIVLTYLWIAEHYISLQRWTDSHPHGQSATLRSGDFLDGQSRCRKLTGHCVVGAQQEISSHLICPKPFFFCGKDIYIYIGILIDVIATAVNSPAVFIV